MPNYVSRDRRLCLLKMAEYAVMEATSERNTVVNEDGSKTVRFDFVRFRSF